MKPAHLALLVIVLLLGIANLLASLGIIGGGGGASASAGTDGWEYRVVTPQEMDTVGFNAVATELNIKPDADGKMQLPQAKVVKNVLLQTTLGELKKENWDLVAVTSDHHYVFRRGK